MRIRARSLYRVSGLNSGCKVMESTSISIKGYSSSLRLTSHSPRRINKGEYRSLKNKVTVKKEVWIYWILKREPKRDTNNVLSKFLSTVYRFEVRDLTELVKWEKINLISSPVANQLEMLQTVCVGKPFGKNVNHKKPKLFTIFVLFLWTNRDLLVTESLIFAYITSVFNLIKMYTLTFSPKIPKFRTKSADS